ncbi:MAG: hypothetical protein OXF76_18585 [Caldilineaceae bacterium]|nr:hypothetical protein [Caldilineaceae bacterium]
MHTRTKSALPLATVAALLVAALLLSAALPAMAQAQDATPTPEAQNQESAPAQEEQNQAPAPTPTPEPPTPTPTAELPTPTPEPQNQESAPDDDDQAAVTCGSADSPPSCDAITKTEDDSADAQSQGPAATPEETPTPDAQNQESAPTPTPEPPTPTPTASPTPTPEAQNQEPTPTPTPEETPTPDAQNQEQAPASEETETETTRPELTFKQSAWSADESDADGTLTITVNINPALAEASAVNITTSTNAAGDAIVPSTLALPAGQSSVDLLITIIGDDDAEEDESFDIELSATDAAPYTLGEPRKTTVTIIDDDGAGAAAQEETPTPAAQNQEPTPAPTPEETPTPDAQNQEQAADQGATKTTRPELTFKQSAWSADETDADGALTITVNINPALAEASAVNITTSTNAAGDAIVPSTLALPAGQSSVDLLITIIGDDDAEEDESFDIDLSATDAAPYTLGAPAKTTITIIDDDRPELTTAEAASAQGAAAAPQKQAESSSNASDSQSDSQGATPQNQQNGGAGSASASQSKLSLGQAAWSVTEADTDGTLNVTVNINPAMETASAVNITTRYGSADATDVSVPATLTLPQGATSVELPITIRGDDAIEGAESFEIELVAGADATYELGAPRKTTITIDDDDTRPTLTFTATDYTVYEPRDPGDWTSYNIARVQIAPALQITSTVSITTRYDTATAADASAPATLTLPRGATSMPFVAITVLGDDLVEGDESFEIELVAVADAPYTLGDLAKTTITIDDHDLPTLSFAQAGYVGSEESGKLDVTVNISPAMPIAQTVPVDLKWIKPSGATPDTTNLTLPAGATSATMTFDVNDDAEIEGAESYEIELTVARLFPSYRVGQPNRADITIEDNDFVTLSLDNAYTVNEADGALDVTVNISPALTEASAVNITTRYNGAASAADVSVPATLTLPKGATSATLQISITADTDIEGAEKFDIELVALQDAPYVLGTPAMATITINDDDGPALASINDDDSPALAFSQASYTVNEADGALDVTVNIDPALSITSTVNITTRYDTATAADVSVPASLTLPADATSATLRIPVTADTDIEGSETLTVALSAVADAPYELGQPAKTTITIIDDPRPTLAFSQAAYTVNEADGVLRVVVNLSSALPGDEFPQLSTVFGEGHTATSADIGGTIAQTKVQAPDGNSSVAVEIPITDDDLVEGSESFSIALTASAAYRLVEPAATTITIVDDEKPTLSFAQVAYTVNEADGELRVVVNLSSALPGDEFPQLRTVFGEDHTATSADIGSTIVQTKVQAPDGTSSVVVKIPITNDTDVEGDENFKIELVAGENAPYELGAPATAAITIVDDDKLPALSFAQAVWTVNEADGALDITVNIAPALPVTSTVNITTQYHGAASAADVSVPATLSLPSGATSATLRIPITADTEIEDAELLMIAMSAVADAPYELGLPSASFIQILDDTRPALTFEQAAYSANEADGAVRVVVNISPSMPGGSTILLTPVFGQGHTATSADINNISPKLVTLAPHVSSVVVLIPITNDTEREVNETFALALSGGPGTVYRLGSPATATVTIVDNDRPVLSFPHSEYFVDEGDTLDLVLNVSAPVGTPQTIPAVTILWTPMWSSNSSSYTRDFTLTQGGTRARSPMVYRMPDYDNHATYNVSLAASEGALYDIGEQGTATVTIFDRDRPSQLTFTNSDYTVDESDVDGVLYISVNIFPPLQSDSTVNITTRFDSATADDVSAPATLTLPQDATSVTFPITIRGDDANEGAESFDIALSAVADAPYELGTPAAATVTINDDDRTTVTLGNAVDGPGETAGQRLKLGETDYTVYETVGALTIPVIISPALPVTSTVNITTSYDTASAADVSVPAALTLPQGATSATLRIPITADTENEGSETLTVTLSAVPDAPYELNQPAAATITIKDDNRPTLAFSQAAYSVNEADGEVVVTVNISPTLPIGSEFWFTTDFGNGHTATLSDINDAMPVVVTLASKLRSVTIPIRITNDSEIEGNETFAFALEGGADKAYRLGSPATANVTIVDDDRATLAFSQAAYTVNEADGVLRAVVTMSPALPNGEFPRLRTVFGEGHTATSADIGNQTVMSKLQVPGSVTVEIPIIADGLVEGAESFAIELYTVEGVPIELGSPATATVTIIDDPRPTLAFSRAAWSVNEADGALDVTVNIAPALPAASTVNITTRYNGAASAADLTVPATLTLPKGATSAKLPITISGDALVEGAETVEIALSAVAGAPYQLVISAATTTITIIDDDTPTLAFSQSTWSVTEADTDGTLNVSVNINPAMETASAVNITTRYDTATAADVSVPTTLSLPKGATSATIPITIRGDALVEGAESFDIELSAVADAPYALGPPVTATITVNDDDRATLAFDQAAWSVNEADGALDIIVNIAPAMETASAVTITTRYDTASAADVTVPTTLTLPKGASSVPLQISITADTDIEDTETFTIALSAVADAPYALGQPVTATITINDDDQPSPAAARRAWTITVTPGDQELDVSWQPPPAVNASDISKYWVAWCLEDEKLGCSPTSRSVLPAADGSGSYTITEHFSPQSEPAMVPLINGARYRVYVYARQADYTLLARSEFSYDNRPQAPGDDSKD